MVADKTVKFMEEVKVKFKILNAWREGWPMARVLEVNKGEGWQKI